MNGLSDTQYDVVYNNWNQIHVVPISEFVIHFQLPGNQHKTRWQRVRRSQKHRVLIVVVYQSVLPGLISNQSCHIGYPNQDMAKQTGQTQQFPISLIFQCSQSSTSCYGS